MERRGCRVCLTCESPGAKCFVNFLDEVSGLIECSYLDIFNKCTQLSLTETDLQEPYRYLCSDCKGNLVNTSVFIKMAESGNEFLQHIKADHESTAKDNAAIAFDTPDSELKICLNDFNSDDIMDLINEIDGENMQRESIDNIDPPAVETDQKSIEKIGEIEKELIEVEENWIKKLNENEKGTCDPQEDDGNDSDQENGDPSNVGKFKCRDCRLSFNYQSKMFEHWTKKHGGGQHEYKCGNCEVTLPTAQFMKFHSRLVHKSSPCEDCPTCGKWITKRNWKDHQKRHLRNVYEFACDKCDKIFEDNDELEKHLIDHCTLTFFTRTELESYLENSRVPSGRGQNKPFICGLCKKPFIRAGSLKTHFDVHIEDTLDCSACDAKFSRLRDLKAHERTHVAGGPPMFACGKCDKRFVSKFYLKTHEKRHEDCDSQGPSSPLHRRKQSHQLSNQPLFDCSLCGSYFTTVSATRRHIRLQHSEYLYDNLNEIQDLYTSAEPPTAPKTRRPTRKRID